MGIAGLLPQLRSITRKGVHVSEYRGQTVAVDAYCLLHRGAYSCSRELVEGEPTSRHVAYCMSRIDLLTEAGVTPLVVFDGGRLPNKADEERSRQRNREENKSRAQTLWQQGNKVAAMECYQKAVDILPAHAKQFVEALKQRSIKYIVAPYEADAQMAYLAINGYVDAVVTEDSDLLCYGCPKVLFKLEKNGEGEEIRLDDLPLCKDLAFQGFNHDLFQEMCVLAGCDFVSSLPGIGIKKAHQHLRRTRCFVKVVRSLRFDGTKVPAGYEERVQRALWTFKHQRVYCPKLRSCIPLNKIADGGLAAGARVPTAAQLVGNEPDFLGPALPDDIIQEIAVGNLDPMTKLPFSDTLEANGGRMVEAGAVSGSSQGLGRHPKSGRGSKSGGLKLGLANGGNTLANYKGFLRGLPKQPGAASGFRPPRPTSESCSQDSGAGMAELREGKQQEQAQEEEEQQQQQEQVVGPERGAQQQQQASSPSLPVEAKPATDAGDTLTSPTEQQWASFRRARRQLGTNRAAVAGRVAGGVAARTGAAVGATTSSYFATQPVAARAVQPGAAAQGGTLLARLKAALQSSPTVDELLGGHGPSEPSTSPAAGSLDAAEGALPSEETDARLLMPGRRQEEQQQQEPKTPLDLGLTPSPTIDDVLGSSDRGGEEDALLLPLPLVDSQLAQPRSVRRRPCDGAPALQEAPLVAYQQHGDEDGIISGSEAGTGLQRHLAAAQDWSGGPPPAAQQVQTMAGIGGVDPISSLSHIAAFQGSAEAAVERASRTAEKAAARHKALQALRPPPHLQGGGTAAEFPSPYSTAVSLGALQAPSAAPVSKRAVPALPELGNARGKENRGGLQAGGSKRQKQGSRAANPFAAFALAKS